MADRLFKPPSKFHPKGPGQIDFCKAIDCNDICFGLGPQGAGKSYLAIAKACESLNQEKAKRIVLYRPYIGTGRTMGFQPGDANEKVGPYLRQLLEYFGDFYPPEQVASMAKNGVIELGALEFIRGRSFRDSIVILDEAQNATHKEIRVFLGRLGEGSKLIIIGDVGRDSDGSYKQSDLPLHEQGALEEFSHKFTHLPGIARVEMTSVDIVRHPLVRAMIEHGL